MVSKEPYKVHSLKKHVEETTSLSANSRNKPVARPSIKKDPEAKGAGIFANNDSDSDSSSSSSDDSDDGGAAFLKDLTSRKAKPAVKTKTRPSKNEEIADSDVERTAAASKSKAAKKAATLVMTKSDSDSDDSSSEEGSDGSEKKVRVNGATSKPKASSTSATSPTSSSESDSGSSSSSDDSSSSDEAESESESETKTAVAVKKPAKKVVATKKSDPASSDSSSDESGSESEAETRAAAKSKVTPVVNRQKAKPVTPSESDESSSEEEDADKTIEIAERSQVGQASLPRFLPPDFELHKSDPQRNADDVARVCNAAYLQGKQVWYFTLPANVPVSVVDMLEFPVDKSLQGDRVLAHNGQDYDVSFDSVPATKSIEILIPSANGSKYQSSRRTVDEVLQVRRITQLGSTTATPASVGSSKKIARPQPKGLKARFQPIGVHSNMGTIGLPADGDDDDDVEMQDAPVASAAKSPAAKSPAASRKEKKSKALTTPKEASSKSKKAKRKHSVSEDEDAAAAEQLMEESVTAQTKSKKIKTASTGSPDLGSEPALPTPKHTFIVPPAIPGSAATVEATSTPIKKVKSKPAPKAATPLSSSSQASAQTKKETPVPVPAVPGLVKLPGAASTPTQKKPKARREKKKPAAASDSS